MPSPLLPQIILFLIAAFNVFLIFYFVNKKQNILAKPLIIVLIAGLLWSAGAAVENQFSNRGYQFLSFSISQTGKIFLPLAWFAFNYQYLKKEPWQRTSYHAALTALFALFALAIWINAIYRYYWTDASFEIGQTATHLISEMNLIEKGAFLYNNTLVFASFVFLVKALVVLKGQMRRQVIVLLISTVILSIAYLKPLLMPFKFAGLNNMGLELTLFLAGLLLFSFGLFHYRLLNVFPIPFQTVVDGMRDGILVINSENEVIHANPAAARILGMAQALLISRPASAALSEHPELLNIYQKSQKPEQVTIPVEGRQEEYEVLNQPLNYPYGFHAGRMLILHNITRRIETRNIFIENQRLLKQSEEKYRSLVENINEVIFTVDRRGIITYVSQAIARYSGFTPEEMVGKSHEAFVHPEDFTGIDLAWQRALSGQQEKLEFRILDKEKNVHFVRSSLRPILHNGEPTGLQGVLTDITERKEAEDRLTRHAAQLMILNDIGEQIASVMELEHVLNSATRLIQQHFSFYHVAIFTPDHPSSELRMRSTSGAFTQIFPENHRLKFGQGMVGYAAEHKEMRWSNDVRLEPHYTNMFPDKILTRSELAVPIMIGDELAGVLDIQSPRLKAFDENDVLVVRTVADQIAIAMENARLYEEVRQQLKERERKENMLRIQRDLLVRLSSAQRLEEMLQVAVDNLGAELHASHVAVSLVDWENQVIRPVVCQGYVKGYTSTPQPFESSIAGWVARYAQPALIADANQDQRCINCQPGTVSLLCVPLISSGRVIGVITLESGAPSAFSKDHSRLITTIANSLVVLIERARLFEMVEKARAELEKRAEELEAANASLRELDRLKSQFLANMSHELRTPLNSIIGFSELMIDGITGEMTESQKECAQDIHDSGKHLLALINDLLDFSKIEAGRMELMPTTFAVVSLFDDLRVTIAPLVEKKCQALLFQQEGELPHLFADALRMKQVFINLLGNANKFTPEGGTILISCKREDQNNLLFTITDNGIGIRPEDHTLIFEEFRQVDGSMTRKVAGTGLGLTISKRIIELHGGKIWVESQLGKGATFFIRLPVNFQAP